MVWISLVHPHITIFYSEKVSMRKNIFLVLIAQALVQISYSATISGTVTDNLGNPINNITIKAVNYDAGGIGKYGTTNTSGTFTISNVTTGRWRILALSSGSEFVQQYYSNAYLREDATPIVIDSSDQNITGIDFTMIKGVILSGTITDSSGLAVSFAQVTLYIGDDGEEVEWTSTNGYYEFDPQLKNTNYRLIAYPTIGSSDAITALNISVETTAITDADIQLNPNGYSVSGVVTDRLTGLPIEDVWVRCWIGDDSYQAYGGGIYTEADGSYQLNYLPEACEVEIAAVPETIYAGMEKEFCLSSDVTGLNFDLIEGSSISGVVIDADTGQPVPYVQIECWNDDVDAGNSAITGADGSFELDLLYPGLSDMMAQPEFSTGYAWTMSDEIIEVDIPFATDVEGVYVAIQKGAPATGRILDGTGQPISNTNLYYNTPSSSNWDVYTDSGGLFEIRLPVGSYRLNIGNDDDDNYSIHTQQVNIADTTTLIALGDINLYSDSDGSTISGTFYNPTSAPCKGTFLAVAFQAGDVQGIAVEDMVILDPISMTGFTDPGGYEIASLPPGNYDIALVAILNESDGGPESVAVRDFITNVAAGTSNVDLTYSSEGGVIRGLVKNTENENVYGTRFMLVDNSTDLFAGFATVLPDGSFAFYNVEPGSYAITATDPMYDDVTDSPIAVTEGGVTVLPQINLDFAGVQQGPDINGDGEVTIDDLGTFADQWLGTGTGDLDDSGTVNLADFAPVSDLWGMHAFWRTPNSNAQDSLVGHWTMNDSFADNTVLDVSGYENNGIAQQNTENLAATGIFDGAFSFNGTSDYIDCGQMSIVDGTQVLSVSAWIYPTDTDHRRILAKGGQFIFYYIIGGHVAFGVNTVGGWDSATDHDVLTLNTWHQIVGTYDGTFIKIYVDNVLKHTKQHALGGGAIAASSDTFQLGTISGNPNMFMGFMDDVCIFKGLLSDEEIESMYYEQYK